MNSLDYLLAIGRGAVVVSVLVLTAAGCSDRGVELHGTVRFDGQPLQGGKITFYHPSQPGRNVTANIQPDGSYKIIAVPQGKVKVTVVALPPSRKHRTQPVEWHDLPNIPSKYTDPATSDLIIHVRSGTQTQDIELTP